MMGFIPRYALPLVGFVFLLFWPWRLSSGPASGPNKVRLNGHTFTLPAGFAIELAAGPPLVERPITADFDDEFAIESKLFYLKIFEGHFDFRKEAAQRLARFAP